jgi:glycosyltransferase involved in cell wall biosynthesis
LRVALIHDWLLGFRGGEKVLAAIADLVPQAELFTLLADRHRRSLPPALRKLKLHTSWLDRLPGSHRAYRYLLPLMPGAIERFELQGFDLIISSSHCVAKGVRVPAGVPHLCFCHTPMRYAWHLRDLYLERVPFVLRSIVRRQLERLRAWDRCTAQNVTQFIANGKTVQQRISEVYQRESVVIHPPVDTAFYAPDHSCQREDYYLVVSALVPNKRIELAVQACQRLGRRLSIIGTGPEERRLKKLAGPLTRFLGWQDDAGVRENYRRCRALLFPGEEDFGMVPIEANACGAPVIAYGQGGATETIIPPGQGAPPTGLWFPEPAVESLVAAIKRLEATRDAITGENCRKQAGQFCALRFKNELAAELKRFEK